MKVAIACTGETLEDAVSEKFGRCPFFLIVDADTRTCQTIPNPGALAASGAGPTAVNEIVRQGAEIVIAGEFGPKAQRALDLAGVRTITASGRAAEAVKTVSPSAAR